MNTDNLIPIDFSRNITPPVGGDKIFNNYLGIEITLTESSASLLGDSGSNPELYVISFTDRPNTGTQPVDDDVKVDCILLDEPYNNYPARGFCWSLNEECPVKTWKPNHAAMLAKFKEQGANMNTFTKENTKEATHFGWNDSGNHSWFYICNADDYSYLCLNGDRGNNPNPVCAENIIELSRPIGERKEDHTIDGVTTYAQPQGAKNMNYLDQETEKADYIYSYSIDGKDAISFYRKQASGIHLDYLCPDRKVWQSSLMTVEQVENDPSTVKLGYRGGEHKETAQHISIQAEELGHHSDLDIVISPDEPTPDLKPIDNRSDDQKLLDLMLGEFVDDGDINDDKRNVESLLSSDKFTITLNKG